MGVLFPLFYSLSLPVHQLPELGKHFQAYVEINKVVAHALAELYRPGDVVWIHSLGMLLVGSHLRALIPGVTVLYYLTTPFPAPEQFLALPWRKEVKNY